MKQIFFVHTCWSWRLQTTAYPH